MEEDAATFSARLKHRAHTYGFFTCVLLVISSIIGDAGGPLFSWLWPLLIIGGLLTLFLAVYLRFDAALFRFIASHDDETEGCRAVDDILARMHLRKRPDRTRPLQARMTRTNSLLMKLHLAFAAFLALFAAITAYGLWTG
ncbi:hypothetical protein J2X72_000166 [Phyllobacterium sp. 1468]|uniref:hypothetical protein n=1 Tax=Phyllobacterium sp. 1468 TaxID=2817759 RepID=UPI002863AAB7|nr:hypothetical protein [Phyllobacterium sp. 1468]MDR6631395.1 hypothetical protein [Phyllobacterium sp. 1468]